MINKLENYVNRAIPYVWDDSESWYEFLAKVITKVNELVDMSNDYFDEDVSDHVEQILNAWYDSGKLSDIVLSAIDIAQSKFDALDARLAQTAINIADFPRMIPENDDTGRFTRALAKLENNGVFKVPDGEYLVSLVTISSKKNCQFFFTGTIKAKDGVDEGKVVAITKCDGSIFYGFVKFKKIINLVR